MASNEAMDKAQVVEKAVILVVEDVDVDTVMVEDVKVTVMVS